MRSAFCLVLLLVAAVAAQTSEEPTTAEPEPTTTSTTPNPGLPFGSFCNGILLRCNRYGETVACMQRRNDTETTTPEPTTEVPLLSLFLGKAAPTPKDVCETGTGVDLGRCQCQRNCKQGAYVDDGEFDPARERCVGLVGSACSLLVPLCTVNGHCNYSASTCVCDSGFVIEDRRCVPAKQ